jgi:cytoskeletal protein CcmA (bactofilin family)
MLQKQNLFGQNDRFRRDVRAAEGGASVPASPAAAETPRIDTPHTETELQAKSTKAEEVKGGRLIVGPDIKLKGAEITDCDTLLVEGRVEASMDARVMQVAESGSFLGTVGVDVVEIHGRFEGEMTARKQLVIRPTGKVSGKVRYGRIVIEEGGELHGDVAPISAAKPAAAVVPVAKSGA